MTVRKRRNAPAETEDERLLELPKPEQSAFLHSEPWRVLRIMGEFVEGFEALADVTQAVTIFGSARVREDDATYQAAVDTARLLGEAGYTIVTGGGPGIMEAGNRGARDRVEPADGDLAAVVDQRSNVRQRVARRAHAARRSSIAGSSSTRHGSNSSTRLIG